jgi:uncharacterized coiled-coil DUF342 family protein
MVLREEEVDSLASLEERITRAVELVSSLKQQNLELEQQLEAAAAERDAARKDTTAALAQSQKLSQELDELRTERKQVRTRIEKLLGQMDLLSAS